jgi:hypothetical protein
MLIIGGATATIPAMLRLRLFCLSAALVLAALLPRMLARGQPKSASAAPDAPFDGAFRETVHPFLKTYCTECHSGKKPRGGLDLGAYGAVADVARDIRRWETVLEHVEAGAMPPAKAKQHPPDALRKEIVAWIRGVRRQEAKRNAGDPGLVPPCRLSNAEYDHTIRDLTGVDLRPAREFPVDPANEAGFDNSADSLALSPAHLDKYLSAARSISEHLILKTEGLAFAPYPVIADTDRDKYGVRQILDFYRRQRTDYADYFHAAWRYRHRAALGQAKASLDDVAGAGGVSRKYLSTVWDLLTDAQHDAGPIALLRGMWQALPAPEADVKTVRDGCERMRDFVVYVRGQLVPPVKNLTAPRMNNGSQPLVMWKNRQMAANRRRYNGAMPRLRADEAAVGAAAAFALTADPDGTRSVPATEAALTRFCDVFPDTFYVTERARVYLDPEGEKKLPGRLLNAGFHSMTGYFRDDGPLYDMVLAPDQQQELDRLWLDFDAITGAPMRQHTSFIWFERSDSSFIRDRDFDLVRAEDKDCTSEAKIKQFAELYLAKARKLGASEVAQEAIQDHFASISASIRRVEQARRAAEPRHLDALQAFAARAYRRPLARAERDNLVTFYRSLREQEGLSHEDAVRDTLVSVLVSPHFLFVGQDSVPVRSGSDRNGIPSHAASGASGRQPLSDHALASRLSYFLWASMPDAELLARAAAGDLRRPEVLLEQARRMLRDPRVRGLATEFAGNWLDFRRFEEHNAVDRERFPAFTDELRQAMFEEPIRFIVDTAHNDRSVLDFVEGKHTFVNPVLARHYGIDLGRADSRLRLGGPGPERSAKPQANGQPLAARAEAGDGWQRIDDARPHGRGGLLPMAAFLTKNAPGLRTSPVKRGYWVVRRVLGEKIPAPPADVPELPADEAKLGDLTLRELLARHRADKACAGCHERFDAVGLAFEGYGPVGERRTADLGGRPVDTRAAFPGGGEGTGLDGLRAYLRDRRQDDFLNNLCRQMLAYALGRTLLPSDDDLIADMRLKLTANDHRFSAMVEAIITSPQFLTRRVP